MKRFVLALILSTSCLAQAAEESFGVLDAEFWFSPRHGDVVVNNARIGALMKRLLADPEAYLVLRYPASESGELWSQELQAWLVSLGLVSDRIELQPRAGLSDGVELVLVSAAAPLPAANETQQKTETQDPVEQE